MRVLICILLTAASGLCSCTDPQTLNREKSASLQGWAAAMIHTPSGTIPAPIYLEARSGIICRNVDAVEPMADGTLRLKLRGKDAIDPRVGAAAAVDPRGYWLTAAHCVNEGPMVLIARDQQSGVRSYPARLVWSGDQLMPGGDAALFHVLNSGPAPYLPMAERPPESGEVLCRGSGIGSGTWSAGEVVSVGGTTDGSAGWFEHSAPLGEGDSGGPAMLPDGRLAGINVQAAAPGTVARDRSLAVWVDPVLVRRLIEADLQRQHTQP